MVIKNAYLSVLFLNTNKNDFSNTNLSFININISSNKTIKDKKLK